MLTGTLASRSSARAFGRFLLNTGPLALAHPSIVRCVTDLGLDRTNTGLCGHMFTGGSFRRPGGSGSSVDADIRFFDADAKDALWSAFALDNPLRILFLPPNPHALAITQ